MYVAFFQVFEEFFLTFQAPNKSAWQFDKSGHAFPSDVFQRLHFSAAYICSCACCMHYVVDVRNLKREEVINSRVSRCCGGYRCFFLFKRTEPPIIQLNIHDILNGNCFHLRRRVQE